MPVPPSPIPLDDPARLRDLYATGLLGSDPDDAYDRLTRLVRSSLSTPVALLSLVADDHQFFKSQQGLAAPWATCRRTPLSHSFCQHVVMRDAPLAVEDARHDALVCGNQAIEDLGVIAYLGVPIHAPSGRPLGALCAIDASPHAWTEEDLATLTDLAALVETELALVTELERRAAVERELREREQALTRFNETLEAEVTTRTAELAEQQARALALAKALTLAEERSRQQVAEVIHDDLQQLIVAALFQASRPTDASLAEVDALLRRALEVGRSLARELAPPAFESDGLGEALAWLAEETEALHGLRVEVACPGDVRLPDRSLLALLLRLVRELLLNVVKHARVEAARLGVLVEPDASGTAHLLITVLDEGAGMEAEALDAATRRSYGLRRLRERLTVFGGTFELASQPGVGTQARLRLPLPDASGDA